MLDKINKEIKRIHSSGQVISVDIMGGSVNAWHGPKGWHEAKERIEKGEKVSQDEYALSRQYKQIHRGDNNSESLALLLEKLESIQ